MNRNQLDAAKPGELVSIIGTQQSTSSTSWSAYDPQLRAIVMPGTWSMSDPELFKLLQTGKHKPPLWAFYPAAGKWAPILDSKFEGKAPAYENARAMEYLPELGGTVWTKSDAMWLYTSTTNRWKDIKPNGGDLKAYQANMPDREQVMVCAPDRKTLIAHNEDSWPKLWTLRTKHEEIILRGNDGLECVGADHFPVKDVKGRYRRGEWSAFAQGPSNATLTMLGAGDDGPIGTERFEAMREGNRLAVFVSSALLCSSRSGFSCPFSSTRVGVRQTMDALNEPWFRSRMAV